MADISLPLPPRPGFSSLPTELKRIIILHMDLPTIKSTRLTCKLLCSLSTPHLIPPHFHFFAHRPDVNRLLDICRNTVFSPYIQSLELNLGEISECDTMRNMYLLEHTPDPATRITAAEEAWIRYIHLKHSREQYTSWMCNPDVLSEAFRSLPNLSALSVSMTNFPLPNDPELALMESIWKIPSTRLLRRELTTERFTIILLSLLPSVEDLKFRNLSHDALPFEFFAQKQIPFESMTPIFHNLTRLRLVIDVVIGNSSHYQQAFANLAICLEAAANLQDLNLCFQSTFNRKIDITPFLNNLLSNSHESKPTFPHLQSLHMEGVASAFSPLENFLTSLAPTLQTLELGGEGRHRPNQLANGGVHLLDGKFVKLFEKVEKAMGNSLKRFVIKGDLVEVQAGGSWFLNREVGWHGVMD
ncbi:hypothetical protein NHQ30_006383 [Ciborinia camelliae]|nr:hypothetical protein NHQ30_006383 [Ciborinia camelliae]